MPLLQPPRTPIELAVSDRLIEQTRIKQKARFLQLRHQQDDAGVCTVYITLRISLFAAGENGDFGPALTGPGFSSYSVDLLADNNCLVDASTGQVLAVRTQPALADWLAQCEGFEQSTMLQGDFFEYLRENQPVQIGNMIRQYIQQADAAGKFS